MNSPAGTLHWVMSGDAGRRGLPGERGGCVAGRRGALCAGGTDSAARALPRLFLGGVERGFECGERGAEQVRQ